MSDTDIFHFLDSPLRITLNFSIIRKGRGKIIQVMSDNILLQSNDISKSLWRVFQVDHNDIVETQETKNGSSHCSSSTVAISIAGFCLKSHKMFNLVLILVTTIPTLTKFQVLFEFYNLLSFSFCHFLHNLFRRTECEYKAGDSEHCRPVGVSMLLKTCYVKIIIKLFKVEHQTSKLELWEQPDSFH